MTFLFALLTVLGFVAMLLSRLNPSRAPEWIAWAFWLAASVVFFWPVIVSAG